MGPMPDQSIGSITGITGGVFQTSKITHPERQMYPIGTVYSPGLSDLDTHVLHYPTNDGTDGVGYLGTFRDVDFGI